MTETDPPGSPDRDDYESVPSGPESRPSFQVATPRMGGKQRQSEDTWIAWTGGKPKSDWSELVEPIPNSIQPNQYRPTTVSSSTKSQFYRTAGLTTPFSRKSDLLTFQTEVMEKLEEYGMDTISYLPSPLDPEDMISVITDHSRYTV